MKRFFEWLARASDKSKGWLDLVFWLLYLGLLSVLAVSLDMFTVDERTGILAAKPDFIRTLIFTSVLIAGFAVRRGIYKGGERMAIKYKDKGNEDFAKINSGDDFPELPTIPVKAPQAEEEQKEESMGINFDHYLSDDLEKVDSVRKEFKEKLSKGDTEDEMIPEKKEKKKVKKDPKVSAKSSRKETDGFGQNMRLKENLEPDYDKMVKLDSIQSELYCRHGSFVESDDENADMNRYFNNIFRIMLPKGELCGYTIPSEFETFFLHFNIEPTGNEKKLETDVVSRIEWYVPHNHTRKQKNASHKEELLIYGRVFYKDNLQKQNGEDVSERSFSVRLRFQLDNKKVLQVLTVDIPIRSKSTIDYAINLFGLKEKNTDSNNDNGYRTDFFYTTRKQDLYIRDEMPLLFTKGRDDNVEYKLTVSCFRNFSMIYCPICGEPVLDMGVPGIVLYNNPDKESIKTSDRLMEYLDKAADQSLRDMVTYVVTQNIENSEGTQLPGNGREASVMSRFRIPLGKFQDGKVIPFTCKDEDAKEEYRFLRKMNEFLRPKLARYPDLWRDKLYLLTAGPDLVKTNFTNYCAHNSMVSQLCCNCWNPLPAKFYNYNEVITIYFFGNTKAGKTVLLCSEYNVLHDAKENKLNQFNIFFFNAEKIINNAKKKGTADEDEVNYLNIADNLRKGKFPKGTSEKQFIPGKLSDFHKKINADDTSYMFNYFDMPGVKSVRNWAAYQHFVYVHSMLDDPLMLGKDSFFDKLDEIYPAVNPGHKANARKFNNQIYLTKIDEYPDFLRKKIEALNAAWRAAENDTKSGFSSGTDYREKSAVYTIALLEILENGLRTSFYQKEASEVIPENIRKRIEYLFYSDNTQHKSSFGDFCKAYKDKAAWDIDFSQTYLAVHNVIVDKCFKRQNDDKRLLSNLKKPDNNNYRMKAREVVDPEPLKLIQSRLPDISPDSDYRLFYDIVVEELEKRIDQAQCILNYLHGLDVIRANYSLFRDKLKDIFERMKFNLDHNEHGNLWCSVYAVSATGYSAIESLIGDAPEYQAEFVYEAHRMLQYTAYEYNKDIKLMKSASFRQTPDEDEGNSSNAAPKLCRSYLQKKGMITFPDTITAVEQEIIDSKTEKREFNFNESRPAMAEYIIWMLSRELTNVEMCFTSLNDYMNYSGKNRGSGSTILSLYDAYVNKYFAVDEPEESFAGYAAANDEQAAGDDFIKVDGDSNSFLEEIMQNIDSLVEDGYDDTVSDETTDDDDFTLVEF